MAFAVSNFAPSADILPYVENHIQKAAIEESEAG